MSSNGNGSGFRMTNYIHCDSAVFINVAGAPDLARAAAAGELHSMTTNSSKPPGQEGQKVRFHPTPTATSPPPPSYDQCADCGEEVVGTPRATFELGVPTKGPRHPM